MTAEEIYHQILTKPMTPEKIALAESHGMIAKKDLKDGVTYTGTCRNSDEATWLAAQNEFVYKRSKFGSVFDDYIEHPEDDKGYDIFVPTGVKDETLETKPGHVPTELRLSPCQAHDSNP
jgi:hypothetical protein